MEFGSLENIYAYIETNASSLKREWELSSAIRRLAHKTGDETGREKMKWESLVFNFHIRNGEVKPIHSTTKEDGISLFPYPSYNDFGENGLAYLRGRSGIVILPASGSKE